MRRSTPTCDRRGPGADASLRDLLARAERVGAASASSAPLKAVLDQLTARRSLAERAVIERYLREAAEITERAAAALERPRDAD